jgi:hypothetical protein
LRENEIEKLAYDLGGVAHVMVEPDLKFSLRLRDVAAGRNVYGGTIAIFVPGHGFARKFYPGWQIETPEDLASAVRMAALNLRGQMPSFGWDWTELQEQVLRSERESRKGVLTESAIDELLEDYAKQFDDIQAENRQLKEQIKFQLAQSSSSSDRDNYIDNLIKKIGPEVYYGEISDRIRFAAEIALKSADNIGVDKRSRVIFSRLVQGLPRSAALSQLVDEITRATKDPKKLSGELPYILCRFGYREKSDNKHIRLEPADGYDGLESVTISKTPSEIRGLKNLRSQIIGSIGLKALIK